MDNISVPMIENSKILKRSLFPKNNSLIVEKVNDFPNLLGL